MVGYATKVPGAGDGRYSCPCKDWSTHVGLATTMSKGLTESQTRALTSESYSRENVEFGWDQNFACIEKVCGLPTVWAGALQIIIQKRVN